MWLRGGVRVVSSFIAAYLSLHARLGGNSGRVAPCLMDTLGGNVLPPSAVGNGLGKVEQAAAQLGIGSVSPSDSAAHRPLPRPVCSA